MLATFHTKYSLAKILTRQQTFAILQKMNPVRGRGRSQEYRYMKKSRTIITNNITQEASDRDLPLTG